MKKEEIKNLTIRDYITKLSVKNKHPSWIFSHIRGFNREWNKKLRLFPCQVCLYNKHVELAHIKAIKDFDKDTPLGIVNNENNILVLCPNHHWEYDNKTLDLSSIQPREILVQYIPLKLTCPKCGGLKSIKSKTCQKCSSFIQKEKNNFRESKITLSKEELEKLVWEKPTLHIAKMFGVSDSAISKRCKKFGISKPPRGYWEKVYHKKQPQY